MAGRKCRHISRGRKDFSVSAFPFSSFSRFSTMGTDEINAEMDTKNTHKKKVNKIMSLKTYSRK